MKKHIIFLSLLFVAFSSCKKETDAIYDPLSGPPRLNIQDSIAIVDLWKKADGPNWVIKWDLKNIYTWGGAGVRLDKEKNEYRIVQLIINLPEAPNVKGEISSSLGELTELEWFQVAGVGITGKIPASVKNLKKMRFFKIQHTGIRDTLPADIFLLPKLTTLDFDCNVHITGKIPDEIVNLPYDMISLRLTYNSLSGKIPSGIRKTKRPQFFGNCFTEFPFEYCESDAVMINLKDNEISGIIPDSILNDKDALERLRLMTLKQKPGFRFENQPDSWN